MRTENDFKWHLGTWVRGCWFDTIFFLAQPSKFTLIPISRADEKSLHLFIFCLSPSLYEDRQKMRHNEVESLCAHPIDFDWAYPEQMLEARVSKETVKKHIAMVQLLRCNVGSLRLITRYHGLLPHRDTLKTQHISKAQPFKTSQDEPSN